MISKSELSNKWREFLKENMLSDASSLDIVVEKSLNYIIDNYDEFDDDAKESINKAIDTFLADSGKSLNQVSDNTKKRERLKALQKTLGKNYNAEFLIQILENKSVKNLKILTDVREIFTRRLQNIIDFMLDVTAETQKGESEFAKISLFCLCIDELLAAFHLTQHSFVNQAYTHIRSIFENLDKIELFQKHPEYASLWCSEDKKKILNELSPASVREKLGKNRYDPLYGYFSSVGTHGSFMGIQSRSAMNIKKSPKNNPEIHTWIGGNPFEHNIVWLNTFLIYVIINVITKMIIVYNEKLNVAEVNAVLSEITGEFKTFLLKYYIKWAKDENLDTQPITEFLNKFDNAN